MSYANPYLLRMVKSAFTPSDPAASVGAPPPGGGGAPPPGPPPGGDPSGGSGPPPDAGLPPPQDIGGQVSQAVTQALAASGVGGAGGAGAAKPPKPDLNTVATDVFQLKKMLFAVFQRMGLPMPDDILDGPNRDPMTGNATAGATGGSDVAGSPAQGGAAPPAGGDPAAGGQPPPESAIEPIQPAFFGGGGGGGDPGMAKAASVLNDAADILRLYARYMVSYGPQVKAAQATREDHISAVKRLLAKS